MIIRKDNEKVITLPKNPNKRGKFGRSELYAEKDGPNYKFICNNFGNYGSLKNSTQFIEVTHDELTDIIISLKQLLREEITTTQIPPYAEQPEPEDIPDWALCDGCGQCNKCDDAVAEEVEEDE